MQCKSFLEQKEQAAKGDKNSTLEWQIYWFVVVVTTLTGLKVWTEHGSKGAH